MRPGLRSVFSRASRPVTPRSRSIGAPTSEASGRDQAAAEHRDADEEQDQPEAHRRAAPRRSSGRRRGRRAAARRPPTTRSAAIHRAAAAGGRRCRPSASLQRLERASPGSHGAPARSTSARVEIRPTTMRDDHDPGIERRARLRQLEADRLEEREDELDEADAGRRSRAPRRSARSRAPRRSRWRGPAARRRRACAASRTRGSAGRP